MVDAFTDWTRRLKASDEKALDELMRFMHPMLLKYTVQMMGDRDGAYDILQESFIKVWSIRHTLETDLSLKALLSRIVYTRALNHKRMNRRATAAHSAMVDPDASVPASVAEEMDAKRLGALMHRWIAALPPRRQEAFRLSRFEGLSHQEIAAVMSLSTQTVTKHIMLALQFLREKLNTFQATGQEI